MDEEKDMNISECKGCGHYFYDKGDARFCSQGCRPGITYKDPKGLIGIDWAWDWRKRYKTGKQEEREMSEKQKQGTCPECGHILERTYEAEWVDACEIKFGVGCVRCGLTGDEHFEVEFVRIVKDNKETENEK